MEYIHLRGNPDDVLVPGEVCIVDAHSSVLFHSFCRPGAFYPIGRSHCSSKSYNICQILLICTVTDTLCTDDAQGYIGGVRKSRWREAPPLSKVVARTGELIQGKLLVGHGLQGDLKGLGLCHPAYLTRDTMNFSLFQSNGHARKLKSLAADLLGKKIQVHRHPLKCAPHSP